MNQRATCSVSAIKVSLPGTDEFNYARPKVIGAPADLPDGPYELRFGGKTIAVRRRKGFWIGGE